MFSCFFTDFSKVPLVFLYVFWVCIAFTKKDELKIQHYAKRGPFQTLFLMF